jgi:hypothetical protein
MKNLLLCKLMKQDLKEVAFKCNIAMMMQSPKEQEEPEETPVQI